MDNYNVTQDRKGPKKKKIKMYYVRRAKNRRSCPLCLHCLQAEKRDLSTSSAGQTYKGNIPEFTSPRYTHLQIFLRILLPH